MPPFLLEPTAQCALRSLCPCLEWQVAWARAAALRIGIALAAATPPMPMCRLARARSWKGPVARAVLPWPHAPVTAGLTERAVNETMGGVRTALLSGTLKTPEVVKS